MEEFRQKRNDVLAQAVIKGLSSRNMTGYHVHTKEEALKLALEQSLKVLRPGGRLVVISYHSLEDRLVKNFMRSGNFEGKIEQDFFGRQQTPFEVLSRKAIVPSAEEVERNPRSRSAKLRVAVKL